MQDNFKSYRRAGTFSLEERKSIIEEYLLGGVTKSDLWEKHTGSRTERGNLNRWMQQLGMAPVIVRATYRLGKKSTIFEHQPLPTSLALNRDRKNSEDLESEVKRLKEQLASVELKAEGYRLMLELAEKELKAPIIKKSATK